MGTQQEQAEGDDEGHGDKVVVTNVGSVTADCPFFSNPRGLSLQSEDIRLSALRCEEGWAAPAVELGKTKKTVRETSTPPAVLLRVVVSSRGSPRMPPLPSTSTSRAFEKAMREQHRHFIAALEGRRGRELTLAAFKRVVGEHMRMTDVAPDRLQSWFSAIDLKGDGSIDVQDWFRISLHCAQRRLKTGGGGVSQALVRSYDTSGDGFMNSKEFAMMVTRLGFGDAADDLFAAFDRDNSRQVSIGEICEYARESAGGSRKAAETEFVNATAANAAILREKERAAAAAMLEQGDEGLFTSESKNRLQRAMLKLSLTIKAAPTLAEAMSSPEGAERWDKAEVRRVAALEVLRVELASTLERQGKRVVDLFLAIDADGDNRLRRREMDTAFKGLLHVDELPDGVLDSFFDELDADNNGSIAFSELSTFLVPTRVGQTDALEQKATPENGAKEGGATDTQTASPAALALRPSPPSAQPSSPTRRPPQRSSKVANRFHPGVAPLASPRGGKGPWLFCVDENRERAGLVSPSAARSAAGQRSTATSPPSRPQGPRARAQAARDASAGSRRVGRHNMQLTPPSCTRGGESASPRYNDSPPWRLMAREIDLSVIQPRSRPGSARAGGQRDGAMPSSSPPRLTKPMYNWSSFARTCMWQSHVPIGSSISPASISMWRDAPLVRLQGWDLVN